MRNICQRIQISCVCESNGTKILQPLYDRSNETLVLHFSLELISIGFSLVFIHFTGIAITKKSTADS